MEFYEILDQILALLQRHGRVTYGALKRQFNLRPQARTRGATTQAECLDGHALLPPAVQNIPHLQGYPFHDCARQFRPPLSQGETNEGGACLGVPVGGSSAGQIGEEQQPAATWRGLCGQGIFGMPRRSSSHEDRKRHNVYLWSPRRRLPKIGP